MGRRGKAKPIDRRGCSDATAVPHLSPEALPALQRGQWLLFHHGLNPTKDQDLVTWATASQGSFMALLLHFQCPWNTTMAPATAPQLAFEASIKSALNTRLWPPPPTLCPRTWWPGCPESSILPARQGRLAQGVTAASLPRKQLLALPLGAFSYLLAQRNSSVLTGALVCCCQPDHSHKGQVWQWGISWGRLPLGYFKPLIRSPRQCWGKRGQLGKLEVRSDKRCC